MKAADFKRTGDGSVFRILAMLVAGSGFAGGVLGAEQRVDLVIADFEGDKYAEGWKATGDAFGEGPARGTLEGQMQVEGFAGAGLVNSFRGGDDATGELSSAPFKIERPYLSFLIGGGGFAGETCIDLLIDGRVVRTATGPNTQSGGSERLEWHSWEVAEWIGREAGLRIVDSRKGGWGHINVDQIVQGEVPKVREVRGEWVVDKRYLIWPVAVAGRTDGANGRFLFTLDGEGEPFCFSTIRLGDEPDFWMFTDLRDFQGRTLTVTGRLQGDSAGAWEKVRLADEVPGTADLYREEQRPRYHFSSRRGWLNDPNGLAYLDGTWHLFYQHNPYSRDWGNMHWGHATSSDLFHWKEGPDALYPANEGSMYSGSGVVVRGGKSPVWKADEAGLVLLFTAAGGHSPLPGIPYTQGLAVGDADAERFTKYSGNPILPHLVDENRDPKAFWHEESGRWIMTLYLSNDEFGIFSSGDLIDWVRESSYRIPGDAECPDLFPLAVDGDGSEVKWVAWGAKGKYLIGGFDGKTFTPEGGVRQHYFGDAYAGQSYDNAPDGRRVHIGWLRDLGAAMAGAAFNQQMTLPMDFSLRRVNGEVRLWIEPAGEVEGLRENSRSWDGFEFSAGDEDPLAAVEPGAFEIEAVIDADSTALKAGFALFGDPVAVWNRKDQSFSGIEGKVEPLEGELRLRIFVDTVSFEVFVNGSYVGRYLRQTKDSVPVSLVAEGGAVRVRSLKVHRLGSVWD